MINRNGRQSIDGGRRLAGGSRNDQGTAHGDPPGATQTLNGAQAKCEKALLASAMRWVFSRFWMVVPVLL